MEFASELLIKALKARARIVEISSGLNRGPEGREAHLRTWRDGMRHLLFILSERVWHTIVRLVHRALVHSGIAAHSIIAIDAAKVIRRVYSCGSHCSA